MWPGLRGENGIELKWGLWVNSRIDSQNLRAIFKSMGRSTKKQLKEGGSHLRLKGNSQHRWEE